MPVDYNDPIFHNPDEYHQEMPKAIYDQLQREHAEAVQGMLDAPKLPSIEADTYSLNYTGFAEAPLTQFARDQIAVLEQRVSPPKRRRLHRILVEEYMHQVFREPLHFYGFVVLYAPYAHFGTSQRVLKSVVGFRADDPLYVPSDLVWTFYTVDDTHPRVLPTNKNPTTVQLL